MSIQSSIIKKLMESKHLPDGIPLDTESLRLSETIVVGGSWYWKSRGKCWTQPTDKSKPREEIGEDEYREVCKKANHGISELPNKKSDSSNSDDTSTTKRDAYGEYIQGKMKSEESIMKSLSPKNLKAHEQVEDAMQMLSPKDIGKKEYDKVKMAYSNYANTGELSQLEYVAKAINKVTGMSIKVDTSSKESKPNIRMSSIDNPEKPNRVNYKKVTKSHEAALSDMGAVHMDGTTYEFSKGKKATDVALAISNKLRSDGYSTQFWTPSGKATDKVTTNFSVEDPKDSYRSIEYNISKNQDNSAEGKVYFDIDTGDNY